MTVRVFGIRHHGPGCARALMAAFAEWQPDAVLVEGPPDAAPVLPLIADPAMQPPVALLVYPPDEPARATFDPFAVFSPEWQALRWGLTHGAATRFIDLPVAHRLAMTAAPTLTTAPAALDADSARGSDTAALDPEAAVTDADAVALDADLDGNDTGHSGEGDAQDAEDTSTDSAQVAHPDPLDELARAAGFEDGDRWWEHLIEQRRDATGMFEAVLAGMTAVREGAPVRDAEEPFREAFMRQGIRTAIKEGFERIAVVCGAWHAPALVNLPPAAEDQRLLKNLPRVKVEATWTPWTNGRLAQRSGYSAGVTSPGWYHHLWTTDEDVAAGWLARAARLLRDEGLSASPAQVVDGVRLAEALAALRGLTVPGLEELTEAARAVFCFDSDRPLTLIHERLILGETLGAVPDATPVPPLARDLAAEQRRLRLKPEAEARELDLDLRKPTDRERSHLLHRLMLLGIGWGRLARNSGDRGTFHERWTLNWQPELAVAVVEAGVWGNTVAEAAGRRVVERANAAERLAQLTALVNSVLIAGLTDAAPSVLDRLQAMSAVSGDIAGLMDALPPLTGVLRYGSVRRTDQELVRGVVDGLVSRVCIGLPLACASLDDDAAATMLNRIDAVHAALVTADIAEHRGAWARAIDQVAGGPAVHGLVAGRCCRLLLDGGSIDADDVARRLSLALSRAADAGAGAAWVEGLLRGSGLVLLHHAALLNVLDRWVCALPAEDFVQVLPLVRRTFAAFATAERRQMGERLLAGGRVAGGEREQSFNQERADLVLPVLGLILRTRELVAQT